MSIRLAPLEVRETDWPELEEDVPSLVELRWRSDERQATFTASS